jgi:RNA polymerase-binding transcription factor
MSLNEKKISEFQERLKLLYSKLTNSLRQSNEEVKQPDESKGYSQHQADEGTDDFDRIISLGLSSERRELLRQVERALEKIQEGSYGVCDVSGDPIPLARLEAIPYATMTVAAQSKFEQEGGVFEAGSR